METKHLQAPPASASASASQSLNPTCLKCHLSQPAPWIYCALCTSPWHWSCVSLNQLDPIDLIEKWFCKNCVQKDPNLVPIYKEPPRKSARIKPKTTSYDNSSIDPESDPDRFINLTSSKKNVIDAFNVPTSGPHKPFRKMKASELNKEWLVHDPQAMSEPIVIDDQNGLIQMGMRMPSKELTIGKIAELVGEDTPVEVIDVASQAELSRWTLGQWAHYYQHPKHDRVRNVISLEVSETSLGPLIQLPKILHEMDWVDTIWPSHLRVHGSGSYPKVQKYCLMSVARCWTDWHIDFAGSSVFYHILRGAKTFYFIRPTVANLAKYERWSGSSKLQQQTWLGDQVNVVYQVSLTAGQTMMIPTGWIHAVHTPMDSLVFGGNFLHSLNIPVQLRIHQIENSTKVPKKFRFPFFIHILWFVLLHYHQRLERENEQVVGTKPTASSDLQVNLDSFSPIPDRILTGLIALSDFLLTQTDLSDSSLALAPKDLLNYLERNLKTDRISNLRQTVLNFQNLLNKYRLGHHSLSSNRLIAKSGSTMDLPQPSNSPHIITTQGDNNLQQKMDQPAETFKSPLQITIKRKTCTACVDQRTDKLMMKDCEPENKSLNKSTKITISKTKNGTNNNHHKHHDTKKRKGDGKVKNDGTKNSNKSKQNSRSVSNKSNTDSKEQITAPRLTGGDILLISNPSPTNEIRFEKRKRPRFENNDHEQEEEEEEMRHDDELNHKNNKIKENNNNGGGDQCELINTNKKENQGQEQSSDQIQDSNNDDNNQIMNQEQQSVIKAEKNQETVSGVQPKLEVDIKSEDPVGDGGVEDVEVRTTKAFNSVVRKWFDPSKKKIIYETRTVQTIIEKIYFDQ